ncbi:MAG TPA: acetyl-CoA carboxylase biotin carboxyl carrier protein subunit [Ramlibacter sp.]|nr:acetyl-CoA carboxylase biotin carboxyl carrier protein subunit [Ramlibacter sp.]
MTSVRSPLQAQVVQWLVAPGGVVRAGDVVVILEAMKMEHEVRSPGDGWVRECSFREGEAVQEGDVLLCMDERVGAPPSALTPTSTPKKTQAFFPGTPEALPQRGREQEGEGSKSRVCICLFPPLPGEGGVGAFGAIRREWP